MDPRRAQLYLRLMSSYWMVFGLITVFDPHLMDMFQTPEGIAAKTAFSDQVWLHGGFDILAFWVVLFTLARETPSARLIRGVGIAGLMPTLAIGYTFLATPYWNPLFLVAGAGCLAFAVWGLALGSARRQA